MKMYDEMQSFANAVCIPCQANWDHSVPLLSIETPFGIIFKLLKCDSTQNQGWWQATAAG